MSVLIGIWAIGVFVVVLNGFSAGLAAFFHIWRSKQARRSRVLTAAAIAGLVPLVVAAPAVLMQTSNGTVSVVGLIVGFGVLSVLTMAVSLPGAVVIARKLDETGDAYRAFE